VKLTARHWLLCSLALGALVALYIRTTNHTVLAENDRFDGDIHLFLRTDAQLNQDVLKVRSQMLPDYDSFPQQIETLKQTLDDVARVPAFIENPKRDAIREQVDGLAQLIGQKEQLVERFKSVNAVLNNSLRYLVLTGSELTNRIADRSDGHELEVILNELMRQVLAFSRHPDDSQTPNLRLSLEKLAQWRQTHAGYREDGALANLSRHVNSVIARQPEADALTQELVALPTGPQASELVQTYEDCFGRELRIVDLYRTALHVFCALLVFGIGYTLYALNAANAHLEHRVRERTRDLSRKNDQLQAEIVERERAEGEAKRINEQLVTVSRQAGMAEVATSVLHNVGNVLTSVNVSCSVVAEMVRKSRVNNVGRTAALLRDNASDLARFFSADPAGKKLPEFLGKLSERLAEEQAAVLDELRMLGSHIEHIKEIVSVQQSYANVCGVHETLPIADLVDDAVHMNGAALQRHGVELKTEYEAVPPISVDKHKVLQILVNLVRNAKHALVDGGRDDKQLLIHVGSGENGRIVVKVKDNGIGIPAENLTRIFAHGFTTKKNGHGFGLHSGVLAAQEMGGRLSVHSDGPGTGATFTLELPIEPPTKSAQR